MKDTIATLTSQDHLGKLEKDLKTEFKDIFQPIPHIDELLTSETARIQLKDAYCIIIKC